MIAVLRILILLAAVGIACSGHRASPPHPVRGHCSSALAEPRRAQRGRCRTRGRARISQTRSAICRRLTSSSPGNGAINPSSCSVRCSRNGSSPRPTSRSTHSNHPDAIDNFRTALTVDQAIYSPVDGGQPPTAAESATTLPEAAHARGRPGPGRRRDRRLRSCARRRWPRSRPQPRPSRRTSRPANSPAIVVTPVARPMPMSCRLDVHRGAVREQQIRADADETDRPRTSQ